jgi:26S proteasome regulatory subunit T3
MNARITHELLELVALPLQHAHLFDQLGIPPPRGILLSGPPGVGKTHLVATIAQHTKAHLVCTLGGWWTRRLQSRDLR